MKWAEQMPYLDHMVCHLCAPRLYHRSANDPLCVYSSVQLHSTLTFVISCVLNGNCEMDRAEAQMPMFP